MAHDQFYESIEYDQLFRSPARTNEVPFKITEKSLEVQAQRKDRTRKANLNFRDLTKGWHTKVFERFS